MSESSRLADTLAAIDQANSQDPNSELADGREWPKELLYGQRMSNRLAHYRPQASEHLQIAARAQHLERWVSRRDAYPDGRTGYKKWRAELALHHAARAGEIMAAQDWPQEDIDRVRFLIQKRQLRRDPETQTLEDVACLVFLEFYLPDFAEKHPTEKLVEVIQKTWKKMSDEGHAAALQLPLREDLQRLITRAIS